MSGSNIVEIAKKSSALQYVRLHVSKLIFFNVFVKRKTAQKRTLKKSLLVDGDVYEVFFT